jgi:hypothetical protein
MTFETLNIQDEGSVLFAEIDAAPMNLFGEEVAPRLRTST